MRMQIFRWLVGNLPFKYFKCQLGKNKYAMEVHIVYHAQVRIRRKWIFARLIIIIMTAMTMLVKLLGVPRAPTCNPTNLHEIRGRYSKFFFLGIPASNTSFRAFSQWWMPIISNKRVNKSPIGGVNPVIILRTLSKWRAKKEPKIRPKKSSIENSRINFHLEIWDTWWLISPMWNNRKV